MGGGGEKYYSLRGGSFMRLVALFRCKKSKKNHFSIAIGKKGSVVGLFWCWFLVWGVLCPESQDVGLGSHEEKEARKILRVVAAMGEEKRTRGRNPFPIGMSEHR